MSSDRKTRIVRAFDNASEYDAHAKIQQIVASRLANHIAHLDIDWNTPALEIGCGTGFLTKDLLRLQPDLELTISDVAPAMLRRARAQIGERPKLTYALIDGERFHAVAAFGLIASSLAFQWFEKPQDVVRRIVDALKPGGWLTFSTLSAGSFREWSEAQRQAGLHGLTRDYPDSATYAEIASETCAVKIEHYSLRQSHDDGMAFLRGLRAIGADVTWSDGRPASAARLRKAIRLFEQGDPTVSYEIAQVTIRREF